MKKSSESLEENSVLFADSATTIKKNQFSEKLMITTNNLMTIQQPLLEIINILNQAISSLETNIKTFDDSTDKIKQLAQNVDQIFK